MSYTKKYYIYSLRHPNRKRVRYVGKTNNPLQRLNDHIKGLGNSKKDKWIRSILSKGMKPVLDVLEECNPSDWHKREAYYIKKFKRGGNKLFNSNRAIKNRTDEDLKKRVQSALLTGEYFQTIKRNDHLIRIVIKTNEFGYLSLNGNVVNDNIFSLNKNKDYYFIYVNKQKILVPKRCAIYNSNIRELPLLDDL